MHLALVINAGNVMTYTINTALAFTELPISLNLRGHGGGERKKTKTGKCQDIICSAGGTQKSGVANEQQESVARDDPERGQDPREDRMPKELSRKTETVIVPQN